MSALDRLTAAALRRTEEQRRWEADRDRELLAARAEGATWEQVADAAGMSRAGVINAAKVAAAKASQPA
jgi:hypothetical protein